MNNNNEYRTRNVKPQKLKKRLLDFLIPLTILVVLSILIRLTDLDLTVSGKFFSPEHGWFLNDNWLIQLLYHYGPFPAITIGVLSLVAFVISFFVPQLLPHRRKFLFLLCALLIGPGLIVNVCFKDHWGRPRPREILDFNGSQTFVPVLEKGTGEGRSFPSGHASTGFYLMMPCFLLRKGHAKKSCLFLGVGLGYGVLMGIGRIAQGGHFFSDILWSAGFVYLTGLTLSWLFNLDDSARPTLKIPS